MGQSVVLPDKVFERLQGFAARRGLSIEQLLEVWAAEAEPYGDYDEDANLLAEYTRALLDGDRPPIEVNWVEIEQTLAQSEPAFETLENAMSAARRRNWTKDDAA